MKCNEGGQKSRRIESIRLESSRLVSLKVDSTYCKSSGVSLAVRGRLKESQFLSKRP